MFFYVFIQVSRSINELFHGRMTSYAMTDVISRYLASYFHGQVHRRMAWNNRPIPQIPQCIRQISHSSLFCDRNVHTYAHFCYKMVLCVIRDWCTVRFAQQIYTRNSVMMVKLIQLRFNSIAILFNHLAMFLTQWGHAFRKNSYGSNDIKQERHWWTWAYNRGKCNLFSRATPEFILLKVTKVLSF